ncbi:MAG: efflux RND transporter permease subunit [Deltaproteobacteria bacterium]|nr:efflux RND transporter permease subunit [Deltaproteobacteria bacterium]
MNIPEFSVKRRITIAMFAMMLMVMGIWALMNLGLALIPDIEFPMIAVITSYPGAGSEEVERVITEPLEKYVGTVSNLKSVKSSSKEGVSLLTLQFEWGSNIDFAAQDVREVVDQAQNLLPEDATRSIISKFDVTGMPALVISATGMDDLQALKKLIEDEVADRLKRLDGVASVIIFGGEEREIQVWLNAIKMQQLNISPDVVINSLRSQNLNLPAGIIEEGHEEYLIRSMGEFESIDELENIVVGSSQYGEPIFLRDIAAISDGKLESRYDIRSNRAKGIMLIVSKQSNANTVIVANKVKKELSRIWQNLPSNIKYGIIMDQGDSIVRVGRITATNAIVGALLAILCIFLFLRNWRPTFAIAIAIPLSIIATFIPIYGAGYTLNIMTLGGLALGVGMLVDNAIVVIENIFRHIEKGKPRNIAASVGASQVGLAITASTLTTIVVFLPMALSSGLAGQLSRGLALTVSFALICSLIVAISVVPMIASVLFKKRRKNGDLPARRNGIFQNIRERYRSFLTWSLRKRGLMLAVLGGVVIITVVAGSLFIGTEFMPKSESDMLMFFIKMPVGTRLSETDEKAAIFEDIALSVPEVEHLTVMVGSQQGQHGAGFGAKGSNEAMVMMRLSNDLKRPVNEISNEIRTRFPDFEDVSLEEIEMGSMMGDAESAIDIKIFGDDLDRLRDYSLAVASAIRPIDGVKDVRSSAEQGRPEIELRINRDKAIRLGLPVALLAQQVRTLTLGTVSTRLREKNGIETDIRVRLRDEDRLTRSQIENLPITLPMGGSVPLKEVVDFVEGTGPIEIQHEQQTRMVHVLANRSDRDLGSIVNDINKAIAPVAQKFPSGYNYEIAGEDEQMRESFRDLVLAFLLSIILVYAIMAALFESLVQPLVIMISLPLAAIGVIWIFLLSGSTLSVTSFMGVIILTGIVVNNAIVLIDHVNQLRRREKMERHEALVQAGMDRIRPILITAITTIFGMLPMALSTSMGSQMSAPMALTVIGGLISATFLTLFYVPIFYSIADGISYKTTKRMFNVLHGEEEALSE